MKMKRILGMALSAVLAFGLAFGVAPAKVAEAETVTDTYYMPDGTWAQSGDGSTAVLYMDAGSTYDSISISGSTVTLSGVNDTGSEGLSLYCAGSSYIFAFAGTNTFSTFAVHGSVSLQLADGATISASNFYVEDLGSGASLTLGEGVVATDGSGNTLSSPIADGTIASSVSISKSGSSSESTPSDSGSGDSSSSGSSSSGSSSSGSSSSGGSTLDYATLAALAGMSGTTSASSTPVEAAKATPDMSANSSIDKATVKTSANGTAKINNIKSDAESIEIDSTVEVNGVSYKVKTLGKGALKSCDEVKTVTVPASVNKFEEGAFTGADNLKTVKINTKKAVKVEKGAFDGLNTSKMTIKVSKKMSDKEFAKLQKNLTKAGYKGKVTRSL